MTGIGESASLAMQSPSGEEQHTPTLKLWQLTEEMNAVLEAVSQNEGVLDDELEGRLNRINEAFDLKAERVVLHIRNLQETKGGIKHEIERLSKFVRQLDTQEDGLRDYLKRQMDEAGKTNIRRPLAKLAIVENSVPTIICEHPEALPWPFRKDIKIERCEVDRERVLAAVKAGEELPEGIKVTTGRHLRIS